MTRSAPRMAKRGRSDRHHLLSILNDFIVIAFVLTGLLLCCRGKQIVVAVDTVSSLTAEDVKKVINASNVSETSHVVFQTDLTMSSLDLLTAAKGWLKVDNATTIVDMTSDCRITALTAVTNITLLRTSLVSCHDVMRDAINVRPTLETYTNAAFSYLRLFGSCLARVVLLTEFHTDLPGFPKCYKGTAIPLLARVVGSWPLSKEQTNQTQVWLKGVASRSALHYVTVMGSSNFLNGIRELVNVYYAWKALETARKLQNGEDVAPDILGEMSVFGNLTLVVEIVGENNTIKKLGTWSEYSGLQIEDSLKGDLHDPSVVIVATLQSPPFVFRVTDENGTHYEGYAIDVLREIAQRLHINYRFTESSDGQYGLRQPNGSWTGIIGDILAGSADMAVGALTVTAEREAVVDFTTPFYEFAGIEILVKQVKQDQNLLFFVTIFSEPMWGAWFGVLLLTGLLLAVFDYMSPFSVRNTRGGKDGGEGSGVGSDCEKVTDGRDTFDLKEGLWLVTASFTLSGPESTPRTLSSRMLVAGFWFFCSIIMANYTANLAAFLTTSRLTTPINSLTDLAGQSKVRYSVVRGTTTMRYFERMARIESNFYELWKNISSNLLSTGDLAKSELAVWDYPLGDTYVKIWSDMEKSGFLDTSEHGLQKVIAEDFALIDEAPYLQYAISQHCGLTTIGKQFSTKSYAFAMPQGSPLTEQVSNYILKLQSETILEKLKQKWWRKNAQGCSREDEREGLSFQTLGGVFLLAGVGVAAGLLLCVLETAWAWISAKRRKRSGTLPPITSRTDLVQEYALTDSYDTITPLEDVTSVQVSRF